jgi:N-acetylated-alpha-linked acidic dipeptidase
MLQSLRLPAILTLAAASLALAQQPAPEAPLRHGLEYFAAQNRERQAQYEDMLIERLNAGSLGRWHELLGSQPHRAGSAGDRRVIEIISRQFERVGLEVEVQELELYLSSPVDASLTITAATDLEQPLALAVTEPVIEEDWYTRRQDIALGWNAYSASGIVEAEIVYANYGRKEDFARLAELGISCQGKIVIARYGGNYRGYKAKYAEEAGAAGLIMYTDPKDSGFLRGAVYPDGGYANEHYIQRGSILTLDYNGDPLTPFVAATVDLDPSQRLDPDQVGLPNIPVQPIGYGAAEQILKRMAGPEVPSEQWQGGLDFPYRLTGGPDLRVRLHVEQDRGLVRTANVLGRIEGERWPDEFIVIGGHHDAWGHGASDPLAGLICVMDLARVMGQMAADGWRPQRTIIFAAWGAEEYGIIGSSEWVEANIDTLRGQPGSAAGCIAYINLDMSAMGPNFGASSWPGFKDLIADASRVVPQARDPQTMVHDAWLARSGQDATEPRVGTLGGGSDHVGFLCHAGIPSISLGASGSRGVSYHSLYDTITWYRKIVGDDYEPALMVSRMAGIVTARLANADLLPTRPHRVIDEAASALSRLNVRLPDRPLGQAEALQERLAKTSRGLENRADRLVATLENGILDPRRVNAQTRWTDLAWTPPAGLRERAWFRNRFVTPDATSGYASWVLPGIQYELEVGDSRNLTEAISELEAVLDRIEKALRGF